MTRAAPATPAPLATAHAHDAVNWIADMREYLERCHWVLTVRAVRAARQGDRSCVAYGANVSDIAHGSAARLAIIMPGLY